MDDLDRLAVAHELVGGGNLGGGREGADEVVGSVEVVKSVEGGDPIVVVE